MSAVRDALALLDVRRLALAIHDLSLPSAPAEDVGRGTPASDEAGRFLVFARRLGFDAIQLGPQGETTASPYEATWFSRDDSAIAWAPLARGDHGMRLFDEAALASLDAIRPAGDPHRVDHRSVHCLQERALDLAWTAFRAGSEEAHDLAGRLAAFQRRHATWLEPYARDVAPDLRQRWTFAQLLAHEQHGILRERARAQGLLLLADLQIGASGRDRAAWPDAFLDGWLLGAPPSRTNPEGQPWGYALFDPNECRPGGADRALALFARRIGKLFDEYDGVRVDHPHGLVDPWVYREDDADPLHAVQHGARLFGTPAHPELGRFAIADPGDLNPDPRTPPWADDWVVRLSPAQIDRYAVLLDELVAVARARGRRTEDIACEVLSTLPLPLARVLERHGLGRFRVTQKADPANPHDVYRSEKAAPADWIMVGTHDTAPIWRLVHDWRRDGSAAARARRIAERLAPGHERASLAAGMARDPQLLALGHFAEIFASPARHVSVFFSDLFGLTDVYNEPGTVSDANWSLRLPPSWRRDYTERLAAGRALDLPRALLLALRARGLDKDHADLVARLDAESLAAPRALLAE